MFNFAAHIHHYVLLILTIIKKFTNFTQNNVVFNLQISVDIFHCETL